MIAETGTLSRNEAMAILRNILPFVFAGLVYRGASTPALSRMAFSVGAVRASGRLLI